MSEYQLLFMDLSGLLAFALFMFVFVAGLALFDSFVRSLRLKELFYQLTGGRPMTLLEFRFTDKISGEPVYLARDKHDRLWLTSSPWAMFRVPPRPSPQPERPPCPVCGEDTQLAGIGYHDDKCIYHFQCDDPECHGFENVESS